MGQGPFDVSVSVRHRCRIKLGNRCQGRHMLPPPPPPLSTPLLLVSPSLELEDASLRRPLREVSCLFAGEDFIRLINQRLNNTLCPFFFFFPILLFSLACVKINLEKEIGLDWKRKGEDLRREMEVEKKGLN